MLMLATIGLAVALSRTPPPPVSLPADRAFDLLGHPVPPPISAANILSLWWFDLFFALLAAVLAGLYGAGVVRMRRRGDAWPWGRTASWFAGVAILVFTTQSGVARYAKVMFDVHMIEHMTLAMIVPIFLVLGAPVTLALRALKPAARRGDRGPREWLMAILHSGYARVVTHPGIATAIFIASTYALYFTPLFEAAMEEHLGHILMILHFLVSGCLFFWVVIGVDPGPHQLPYVGRLLLLFVTMPFHAFFGIALMMTGTLIAPGWYEQLDRSWGGPLLQEQQNGGAIAWGVRGDPDPHGAARHRGAVVPQRGPQGPARRPVRRAFRRSGAHLVQRLSGQAQRARQTRVAVQAGPAIFTRCDGGTAGSLSR
ncbi:cytochrome c oxidase assembly protein [Nonomuraea ferruginea]